MNQKALRIAGALLFLLVLGVLLIGALFPPDYQTHITHYGFACPLRHLLGIVCPFCGMTRAGILLGAGHLKSALQMHPLSPLILLLSALGAWKLMWGKPLRVSKTFQINIGIFLLVVLVFWIFNLLYNPYRPIPL